MPWGSDAHALGSLSTHRMATPALGQLVHGASMAGWLSPLQFPNFSGEGQCLVPLGNLRCLGLVKANGSQ